MTERTYEYKYTRMKKDGSIGTYTKKTKYVPKKKTREITEEMKNEIIYKWKLGVSKAKLRREYDLSQSQLDSILLTPAELDNEVINMLSNIQLGGSSETNNSIQPEVVDLLNKILKLIHEYVAQSTSPEVNNKNENQTINSMNLEVNNENEINENESLPV